MLTSSITAVEDIQQTVVGADVLAWAIAEYFRGRAKFYGNTLVARAIMDGWSPQDTHLTHEDTVGYVGEGR